MAAIAGYFFFDRLPVPAEYGFARTLLLFPGGALLIAAGVYALFASGHGWQRPVLVLGATLLLLIPLFSPLLPKVNEGFIIPADTSFACRAGNYKDGGYSFSGSLSVTDQFLTDDYLWQQVRVNGGAYGTGLRFQRNGQVAF